MAMFRVVVLRGEDKGKSTLFGVGQITIGRDPLADFRLFDTMVSRFHGVIDFDGRSAFRYRDLKSANGSFVRIDSGHPSIGEMEGGAGVAFLEQAELAVGRSLLKLQVVDQDATTGEPEVQPSLAGLAKSTGPPPVFSNLDETPPEKLEVAEKHAAPPEKNGGSTPARSLVDSGAFHDLGSRLDTLLSTTARLSRNLELEPLLQDIVKNVIEFMKSGRGVLLLANSDGAPTPRIAQDRSGHAIDLETLKLSQTTIQKVWSSGESICVADLAAAPGYQEEDSIVELGLKSILCVPLRVEEDLLGLLYVDQRYSAHSNYTDGDLAFLDALASHAAMALYHSQIHDKLRRSYADLKASRNELEQAYKQLQELQEGLVSSEKMAALGELAVSITHELAQPLTLVVFHGDLALRELHKDGEGVDLEKMRSRWKDVHHAGHLMTEIVQNVSLYSRRSAQTTSRFPLGEAVEKAVQLVKHLYHRLAVRLVVEPESLGEVIADPNQLTQVFVNLLANAADALKTTSNAEVRVFGEIDPSNQDRIIFVKDNGPGVSEENRPRIFHRFFTTKPPGKGTGLGLSIVRQIVEGHNGSIQLMEQNGPGTTFALRFPSPEATEREAKQISRAMISLPPGNSPSSKVDWKLADFLKEFEAS